MLGKSLLKIFCVSACGPYQYFIGPMEGTAGPSLNKAFAMTYPIFDQDFLHRLKFASWI